MSVYGISSSATVQPAGTADAQSMDQTAFLKLMTAQLQAQDPFNPTDNSQMVAQMAQFSATAGIAEMNTTMKSMASDLAAARLGNAASWIGHTALVETDQAQPLSDGSYAGEVTIPNDADTLSLKLVDASGNVVHSQDFGAQQAGSYDFDWDGKDASGNAVAGPVKMIASATNSDGVVKATTSTWTTIAGVQSPAGGAETMLVTPLGLISPSGTQRIL